jgi:multicomponent Na+:H+ antiporter subunit C
VSVLLAFAAAALFGIGTYLLLQRTLSRIIVGLGLMTHGANVLWILAGRRGSAPIVDGQPAPATSDPLPQALTLTAIVITFGVTAFLLALAFRSWILTDDDEVEHDVSDLEVRLGRRQPSDGDDDDVVTDRRDGTGADTTP